MSKIRTAVIGAGKMGGLHSRIYSQLDSVELVAVVDSDLTKAQASAKAYGGRACSEVTDILNAVDAVTVAVPTEFHAEIAEPFLSRGIPVLMEKPLAATLEEARHLLQVACAHGCILQVGYSERFNPVIQAMKRLDFTPRFIEAQRISPFTFRSTDVGVVLDMMIHDIDIILSMAHSFVRDVQAVGVNILGEHEDIANVRLEFENGCVATLTASRLAMKSQRKVRVFSEQAYLSLDNLEKTGIIISKTANIDMVQKIRGALNDEGELDLQALDWTELVNIENLDIDEREPLMLEQEAFIKAVAEQSRPEVSAEDAIAAMELAEKIVNKIAEHKWEGSDSAAISAEHFK